MSLVWLGASYTTGVNAARGQTQAPAAAPAGKNENEIATKSTDAEIKVRVNLVLVRAVVRDNAGKVVSNLRQEDFQLLDNGKVQAISTFSVEKLESPGQAVVTETGRAAEGGTTVAGAGSANAAGEAAVMPQRYVALVLDDSHLKATDSLAVKAAAEKLFVQMTPAERVGIFSTSGEVSQDFTGDTAALRKALTDMLPHATRGEGERVCPDISYYQADLIENKHNPEALAAGVSQSVNNNCPMTAPGIEAVSQGVLAKGDQETRESFQFLGNVARRMASLPGQRVIVLVSPGFLLGDETQQDNWGFIDRAMRAGIVVNTIDARGLYTEEMLRDIAAPPEQPPTRNDVDFEGLESTYRMQAQIQAGQVLSGIAGSTGGTYFHNRNDLLTGINEAMATPSVSYVLGFSPQNLKVDGKFHKLKVVMTNGEKYQIQARTGYYAPRVLADPVEMAKQEVRQALFSQDEIMDVPVELKTQFFKVDAESAQLTVYTHMDVKGIRFRKAEGRSYDEMVVATAIFDNNGMFVKGEMREISLKLKDSSVERLSAAGFTIKIAFTVKPGTYLVRSVVRGEEGAQLTARNASTVIPQ